jgi:hypothetical protein
MLRDGGVGRREGVGDRSTWHPAQATHTSQSGWIKHRGEKPTRLRGQSFSNTPVNQKSISPKVRESSWRGKVGMGWAARWAE